MTIKKATITAKPLTQDELYATPEFKATERKPLNAKRYEFIAGYVWEGRAFQQYKVLEDGLIILSEIEWFSCIHDGHLHPVKITESGFEVLDLGAFNNKKNRKMFAELEVTVTLGDFIFN